MENLSDILFTNVGILLTALATIFTLVLRQLLMNWGHRRRIDLEKKNEIKQQETEEQQKRESAYEQTVLYKRKISNEVGKFRILDMVQSIDLAKTYVQLKVTEDEPLHYAAISESIESYSDAMLNTELSLDKDASDEATLFSPHEAVDKFQHIVVLGDPGAGKTTMMRYMCLSCAQSDTDIFPIFVSLNKYTNSDLNNLLDYIYHTIEHRYGFSDLQIHIKECLENGNALILLDGLDEVTIGDLEQADIAYRHTCEQINDIALRYPDCKIAVTSRRAGWKSLLAPSFKILSIKDFSWDEIVMFTTNWFKHDPKKADRLQATLANQRGMQSLAANPLLLSLIAIVYDKDLELPERRAKLYERCVQVLLTEWDAHRGIKRANKFTTDRKRNLLEEIAFYFHEQRMRYFSKEYLLKVIRDFLPTVDISPDQAPSILFEITTQHGLIKEQAADVYGFLHLTIQEYFAAVQVNANTTNEIPQAHYIHDPWWEEVWLLMANMMHDASLLLNSILDHKEDIFKNNLLLAGKCLVGVPRIKEKGLREKIISKLQALLEDKRCFIQTRTQIPQILIEIGGEQNNQYIRNLLQANRCPSQISIAAIESFRNETHIPLLLKLVKREDLPLSVREKVLDKLAEFPKPGLAEDLLRILHDESMNKQVRDHVARALGFFPYDISLKGLLEALDNPNAGWYVGRAISHFPMAHNPQEFANLIKTNSYSLEARWGIAFATLKWKNEDLPLARALLFDPDIEDSIRVTIIRSLQKRRDAPEMLAELKKIYKTPQSTSSLKAIAVRGIYDITNGKMKDKLRSFLMNKSVSDYVRWKIIQTFVSKLDHTIFDDALKILQDSSFRLFMRLHIADDISKLTPPEKIPTLFQVIGNESINKYVRARIANSMSSANLKSYESELLSMVCEKKTNAFVRANLVSCLSKTETRVERLTRLLAFDELYQEVLFVINQKSKQNGYRVYFNEKKGNYYTKNV